MSSECSITVIKRQFVRNETKKSMIVLKFSNARSWMKKSKLDYSINIEREDDDDDDSEGK